MATGRVDRRSGARVGERRTGQVPTQGDGWDGIADQVDGLAMELVRRNRLPGVAVAVTKEGRLVLAKGYGYALDEKWARVPMRPSTRINVGSVTKAAVTGPATWQVLSERGIDPRRARLYGPHGLFEGKFDEDIELGIERGMKAGEAQAHHWREWYREVTVQHLFDHQAGFTRGGDAKGTAKMFGIPVEERTHELVHRHFLRTRPLLYEPGTRSKYSNHGFGLLALVIEQLTGTPFEEYVREEYLKPRNLHLVVRPTPQHPDSCDSHRYRPTADGDKLMPFKHSAHAAGGYRASMEGLARLMRRLDEEYTDEELNRMGWFRNRKGRLTHNGLLGKGGGTADAKMYPEGYTTSDGIDLSDVHVCVATNTKTNTGDVGRLGRDVARLVGESDVPSSFDLWRRGFPDDTCEYCREGVSAVDYQSVFDEATTAGYRLEWVDGFSHDGAVRFNVVFRPDDGHEWVSHHRMTAKAYQKRFDQYADEGYSLVHVDSYRARRRVRYAAIWQKTGGPFTAYHGLSARQHQRRFESLVGDGWRPTVISVVSIKGNKQFTALYTRRSLGRFVARSSLTPAVYQTAFEKNADAGRHLVYLNSYRHRGGPRFTAIWAEKPAVSAFRARHGVSTRQYPSVYWDAVGDGLQTRAITGVDAGDGVRLAAYWTT